MGFGLSIWVLYQQAADEVQILLKADRWPVSGSVHSGELEIWEGMQIGRGILIEELRAAGFTEVKREPRAGEFRLTERGLTIMRTEHDLDFETIPQAQFEVEVDERQIHRITPSGRAVLGFTALAEFRGPENESRSVISISDLPAHLPQAVLAMEDARFYEHEGLDPLGIARAVGRNLIGGGPMQGGSTLTQQVIKNLTLRDERTYERKAQEALLSIALERTLSKEEILEIYLNEIYWGQVGGAAICGVDQAAQAFFGKPSAKLNILESATLAGIISSPNPYSPIRHPEAALERRNIALKRMVQAGFLLEEERLEMVGRPLEVVTPPSPHGGWVVDVAVERVEAELGEGAILSQGLQVYSSLNPFLQRLAEEAIATGLAELEKEHPAARNAQAALVAQRVSDGAVVAMVGGRDATGGAFNRAMQSRRHIGSTIKPITAMIAFDLDVNLSPTQVVEDIPISRTDPHTGQVWNLKIMMEISKE